MGGSGPIPSQVQSIQCATCRARGALESDEGLLSVQGVGSVHDKLRSNYLGR